MAFTFIHTADWQLGKPFGGFPLAVAARLQEARFDAIGCIADAAATCGARHILVAGDVFDALKPQSQIVRQFLARLADHPGLVWHFIAGNHDPDQPGSVWDDVRRVPPGPNVRVHGKSQVVEIAPGVQLLPAPLHAKAMSDDPTAWMDASAATTPPGTFRVGMAHGSVFGFSSEGDAAIPIAPARADSARLDYLALGDWHGTKEIGPRLWYSGTPEPDGFKDNAPGHVLAVTIEAPGAAPTVQKIATAHYLWQAKRLDVTSAADVDHLIATLRGADHPAKRTLLALTVTGRVPLSELPVIDARLADLEVTVAHAQIDRTRLTVIANAADMDAFGSGAIATVAAALVAATTTGDAPQQAIATRALAMLARLNAEHA